MIEALEIGISLALGDGVAEGVAAARRDVHAIETAMTAGAVSVQRLRDAATGALGVPQAVAAGKAKRNEKAVLAADPLAAGAVAPASFVTQVIQVAQAASAETGPAHSVFPPASSALPPPETRPPPAVTAPGNPASGPDQQAPRNAPASLYPPPAAAVAQSRVSAGPGAPAVTILRMQSEAPTGAAELPGPSGTDPAWPYAPPVGRSEAAPAWTDRQAAAAAPAGDTRPAGSGVSSGGWIEPAPVSEAAAPVGVLARADRPSKEGGRDAFLSPADAAPPAQKQEQARIEGDVFLDGTLVGRWMSTYLAREAGRASAGPTGFDARRNPLLPGATVGM